MSITPAVIALDNNDNHSISDNAARINWTQELQTMNDSLDALKINLNHFYLCSFAILTILIPIGITFMDIGLVRTKSSADLLLKTSIDFLIGCLVYWLFGYALAWGDGNAFVGFTNFAFAYLDPEKVPNALFHMVYANMASMVISGALADRLNLLSYFVFSVALSGFAYPLLSRWGWHPIGWLKTLGYHDFSGSGLVFLFAGSCALVACKIIGPREGRFRNKNEEDRMPGHSLPLFGLGFMLLASGFLGFNAGSLLVMVDPGNGPMISYSSLNTLLACSSGALASLFIQRLLPFWGHYWSYVTMCCGASSAMVASCAGCSTLEPWGAYVTGIFGAIAFIITRDILEKIKIDDPTHGIAIYFGGGFTGLLTSPFLISDGILMKADHHASAVILGVNFLGACIIIIWAISWTLPMFILLKRAGILRVPHEIETAGIDLIQQDEQAYPPSAWSDINGSIFTASNQGMTTSPSTAAIVERPSSVSNPAGAPEAAAQPEGGRRRKPAPRLQTASLSSMNLISESTEIAMEQAGLRN